MSRSGDVTTWSLEMPVNDDGLFALQCRQSADHRFAVNIDDGPHTSRASESERLHCPYCGYEAGIDDFYTPGQRRRFDDAVSAVADQMVADLARRLTSSFRRSTFVTVSPSRPPSVRRLHSYVPEPSRRTVTCGTCGETYAVFGMALYCVSCGQLSPAECFAESLGVERRVIAHLADLSSEVRDQMEADGVLTRTYENSVKNTFTAVEVLLGQVFRARITDAESVLRGKGNVFQRLPDASDLYETYLAIPLATLDSQAWAWLLEAAALRHLLTHSNGIVDEKYLRAVPGSRLHLGQRAHVGRGEADSTLSAAASIVTSLLSAL